MKRVMVYKYFYYDVLLQKNGLIMICHRMHIVNGSSCWFMTSSFIKCFMNISLLVGVLHIFWGHIMLEDTWQAGSVVVVPKTIYYIFSFFARGDSCHSTIPGSTFLFVAFTRGLLCGVDFCPPL
jgi:hypothetical protein